VPKSAHRYEHQRNNRLTQTGASKIRVSIHAPARSATGTLFTFNGNYRFQSTRPRGARLGGQCSHTPTVLYRFNPRARAERDPMRANHPRTVRKLVNRSQWLRGSRVGRLLSEQADKFIEIKASTRFPRSPGKQIEFLSRCLGAMLAGYEPSTGDRYAPELVQLCAFCHERPAAIDLVQTDQSDPVLRVRPWCGHC
jgi:hypothetical protein